MKKIFYFLFSFSLIFMMGCETELDVNAPYERIPIIYGLIDHNEDVHFLKITKIFNGQLDAFEMAQVRDSSEAFDVTATIEEVDRFGNIINVWDLKDTTINNKDTGLFYAPQQRLFYFEEPNLTTSNQYRLTVDAGGEEPATCTISLIEDAQVFASSGWSRFIAGVNFYSGDDFIPLQVDVLPPKFAKRVEVNMYFTYCEEFSTGIISQDTLKYELGIKTVADPESPKELTFTLPEGQFFTLIDNQIPSKDETPNLVHRIPNVVFFEVVNAAEDFHTYMEVYGPGNTVFQEKPPFTNIENGIGLFSSRVTYNTIEDFNSGSTGFGFSINTLDALAFGSPDDPDFPQGVGQKGFIYTLTCP